MCSVLEVLAFLETFLKLKTNIFNYKLIWKTVCFRQRVIWDLILPMMAA